MKEKMPPKASTRSTTSSATSASPLDKSKTIDATSSPSGNDRYKRVYDKSFEESRYSGWVDKNKTLAATSLPSDSKGPIALEAKDGSVAKPVMLEVGGAVEKKGEEIAGIKTVRVAKRVVRKVPKRVQKEENDGVGNEAQIESSRQISPNCVIVNEVNTNSATEGYMTMRVVSEKVVTEGTERVVMEETYGDFGKLGVNNETEIERPKNIVSDSIEFQTPNYDSVNNVNTYNVSVGGKTARVLGAIEFQPPNSDNNSSSASVLMEIDRNTSGLVAGECVNNNTCAAAEKKVRMVRKKIVRVVRKKVVKKGPEKEKKETPDEDLVKVGVLNEAEVESSNMIESSNLNSDIANTDASNLLEVKNHGSDVADNTKIEKASPFNDASDDVNNNANAIAIKEEKTVNAPRRKVVTKGLERMKKDERNEVSEKVDMDNKLQNPVSDLFQVERVDSDVTVPMDTQKPKSDNEASDMGVENAKTNVDKEEKEVRAVRKKVTKKELKTVKKEQSVEELGEAEANKNTETETETKSSSLRNLGAIDQINCENNENEGEEIVLSSGDMGSDRNPEDIMEVEKVDPEGSERIEGSMHEVESCDISGVKKNVTMADDMVLSEEIDALERRKGRKTEIFIGGLHKDALEEDVRSAFQEVGEIVEVTVKMHEKTGKNKGFAFVRYASAADAKKAMEKLDKVEICGKHCSISFVKGNDTIFLGNIDKRWKNEDIVKLLQDVGVKKIDKVTIKPDPENPKRNRGFAFLEIQTIRDAQKAFGVLEKKGFLGNQKIRVEWAKEVDEEEMQKVKTVYAEYLPVLWDEKKVEDYFKKFGEIENVVLGRNLVSSGRKDFAFVNYKTREAALKCVKEFTVESPHNEGSKVRLNVSLAKSTPKAKQGKHASRSVIMISNQEKAKAAQTLAKPNRLISKGESIIRYHDYDRVVVHPNQLRSKGKSTSNHCDNPRDRASTNDELVQLLREQASWKQPQTSSAAGPADLDYSRSFPIRKRQFSHLQEDDPIYSDHRGYPRPRTESAFPSVNPSRISPVLGMQTLPHYYQQGLSYPSGLPYEVDGYFKLSQTRGRPPSGGGSRAYRRY